jgi:hypothetical protein
MSCIVRKVVRNRVKHTSGFGGSQNTWRYFEDRSLNIFDIGRRRRGIRRDMSGLPWTNDVQIEFGSLYNVKTKAWY